MQKPKVSLIGYEYDEDKQKGKLFYRNITTFDALGGGEEAAEDAMAEEFSRFKNINKISITKASEEVSYALLQASLQDRSTGGDLKGN